MKLERLPRALLRFLRVNWGELNYVNGIRSIRGHSWRGLLHVGNPAGEGVPTGGEIQAIAQLGDTTRGILTILKPWWKDAGTTETWQIALALNGDTMAVDWTPSDENKRAGRCTVFIGDTQSQTAVAQSIYNQVQLMLPLNDPWYLSHGGVTFPSAFARAVPTYTWGCSAPFLYKTPYVIGMTGAYALHEANTRDPSRVVGVVPLATAGPRIIATEPSPGLGVSPLIVN